jgi:hypothetical protein
MFLLGRTESKEAAELEKRLMADFDPKYNKNQMKEEALKMI